MVSATGHERADGPRPALRQTAMSAVVMLDTNAVVALINGQSSALEHYVRRRPVCISAITAAELRYGLACRPAGPGLRQVVEGLLATIEILPWTAACAETYAELRTRLEAEGKTLGALDLLIAAQARAAHCPLITAEPGFAAVPGLDVVDWSAEPAP